MCEQRDARRGWFARWREHRRGKRQQALERQFFLRERARSVDGGYVATAEHLRLCAHASAYGTEAMGLSGALSALGGGDGGGC